MFSRKPSKTQKKNKVVTLMVFKNVLRNKSLAEIKENCTLGGSSYSSSETQGQSVGRKGATKVFKHRRKSPWVPTLTGPFPNGQVNAGS